MTSHNHSQPHPTEDEIERLARGEPIADPALDPLAALRPRIRPDFHRALQEELLMLQSPAFPLPESLALRRDGLAARRPQPRTLLTLGAALIAALTLGLFIIAGTRPPGPIQTSTTASAVVRPNPDLQPVIVALQNLPRGMKIDQDAFTSGALTVAYFDPAVIREGMIGDPTQIIGKIVRADLTRWNPLLLGDLTDAEGMLEPVVTLPQGLVAVAIPADQIVGDLSTITKDSRVAVAAQMLFVDIDASAQQTVETPIQPQYVQQTTQVIVPDALVVNLTPTTSGPGAVGSDIITLAVTPAEATTIAWALDARLPILFLPVEGSVPTFQIMPTEQPAAGSPRTEVRIPRDRIESERLLLIGDNLDLVAALPVEGAAEGAPSRQYQYLARGAHIIGQDGDTFIFTVIADEAALIDRALETNVTLSAALAAPAKPGSGYEVIGIPVPSYYGRIDVYQMNPIAQVGDRVDVVVVEALGRWEDMQMRFVPVPGSTVYIMLENGESVAMNSFRPVNATYEAGYLDPRRIIHNAEVISVGTYTDALGREFPLLNLLIPQINAWRVRHYIGQGYPYAVFNSRQQP